MTSQDVLVLVAFVAFVGLAFVIVWVVVPSSPRRSSAAARPAAQSRTRDAGEPLLDLDDECRSGGQGASRRTGGDSADSGSGWSLGPGGDD